MRACLPCSPPQIRGPREQTVMGTQHCGWSGICTSLQTLVSSRVQSSTASWAEFARGEQAQ